MGVGDGLGESPPMACEVFGVVLTLTEGIVGGEREDAGAVLASPIAVGESVFDTDHDQVGVVGRGVALGDDKASVANVQLDAVVVAA